MSVPEIVTQVFQDRGFTDFEQTLFEDYEQREYVVQYRETDFQFISRLLEREGIYYFFRHEDGKHTLVLTDSPQAHQASAGCEQLPYAPDDEHRDATTQYMRQWKSRVAAGDGRVRAGGLRLHQAAGAALRAGDVAGRRRGRRAAGLRLPGRLRQLRATPTRTRVSGSTSRGATRSDGRARPTRGRWRWARRSS